jgi:hypothetical protein
MHVYSVKVSYDLLVICYDMYTHFQNLLLNLILSSRLYYYTCDLSVWGANLINLWLILSHW